MISLPIIILKTTGSQLHPLIQLKRCKEKNSGEKGLSATISSIFSGNKNLGPIREAIIHHSIDGYFSIRQDKWKLELCGGSGGWSYTNEKKAKELGLPEVQLYDLENDIAEENNVADKHPEIVDRLSKLLQQYIDDGRSKPKRQK